MEISEVREFKMGHFNVSFESLCVVILDLMTFLGSRGKIMQPSFDFMHRFSTSLVSKNKTPSY